VTVTRTEVAMQTLNPVGYPPVVAAKPMAHRLESLSDKRIFVIDPRFDDSTNLLERLMRWMESRLPDVEVEYVTLPGAYYGDFSELWSELALRGDAAVIGVGHCSTCAPAIANMAMALESRFGLPTVTIHTEMFARVVNSVCQVGGMPDIRRVFIPHPVIGQSDSVLQAYLDGMDPMTGKPVLEELLSGLTQPLDEHGRDGVSLRRDTPRVVEPDTEERLHQLFYEKGWTDKLPIVLPTVERVEAMLAGTSRDRDDIVGHLRPTFEREAWGCTVEKVAVNAVMAGAQPEYLPVILALASSGVSARPSSTASMNAMAIINGPIRAEIDANSGLGAMGPYSRANATIGRTYGLLSQNVQGGSTPGVTYMGSQGNGLGYNSLCFAENEEGSPWEPLHVSHGFDESQSTVSVFIGCAYMSSTLAVRPASWREQLLSMVLGMDPGGSAPTLLLDPLAAQQFVDVGGFADKQQLIDWVCENAVQRGATYWDTQIVRNYIYPNAAAGMEPFASKLAAGPDAMVELFDPGQVGVVVVGGGTKPYWCVAGARYARTVSIDEWR
jgi:hypothetical protein